MSFARDYLSGWPYPRQQVQMPLQIPQMGEMADKLRKASEQLDGVLENIDAILRDQEIEAAIKKHLGALGDFAVEQGKELLKEVGPAIGKALLQAALEKAQEG